MSRNSEASRPNKTYSLPRELGAEIRSASDSLDISMSSFVERAVIAYLKGDAEKQYNLDIYNKNIEELRGNIALFSDEIDRQREKLESIESNIRFQTEIIEGLFGLRKQKIEKTPLSDKDFTELLGESMAYYGSSPDAVSPPLISEHAELKSAAQLVAIRNAFAEAVNVMESIRGAMTESMFIQQNLFSVDLLDAKYRTAEYPIIDDEDLENTIKKDPFLIASIYVSMGGGDMYLPTRQGRPYCRISSDDHRSSNTIFGRENIEQFLPVLISDYLAFRRFSKP